MVFLLLTWAETLLGGRYGGFSKSAPIPKKIVDVRLFRLPRWSLPHHAKAFSISHSSTPHTTTTHINATQSSPGKDRGVITY